MSPLASRILPVRGIELGEFLRKSRGGVIAPPPAMRQEVSPERAAAPSPSHNLLEADEASSTSDFIAKLKTALREAKEARNCLKFLVHCQLTPGWDRLVPLEDEARQLSLIFATILIKVKRRYTKEKAARRKQ